MALAAASLLLRCRVAWAFSVHHLKARQLPARPWGVYSSAQRLFAASGDESTREVAPLAVGEMGVKLAGLKRTLTEQQQEQQQEQPREWDRQGLRKECERLVMRQMKKVTLFSALIDCKGLGGCWGFHPEPRRALHAHLHTFFLGRWGRPSSAWQRHRRATGRLVLLTRMIWRSSFRRPRSASRPSGKSRPTSPRSAKRERCPLVPEARLLKPMPAHETSPLKEPFI